MNLPQEIIGEILSYLPSDDRKSLRSFSSYSLVSKSWLDPSRRTLFAKFSIRSSTYDRFLNTISPTKTELLRYVRSLSYFGSGNEYRQQHRPISVLRDYFPSLRQLRALAFRQMQIEPTIPGCLDLFSAFQHTLSSLCLSYVSITWSGFASLVGYFPNLKDLLIYHPLIQMDDQPVPHPSRALRGKLSLLLDLGRSHNADVLADHFPRLKPEYEEVLIGGTVEDQCRYLPIFQKVLKHLTIQQAAGYASETLDLSLCPELQEIHIWTVHPHQQDVSSISSVTSINLRRIVLNFRPVTPWKGMTWDSILDVGWSHLDDMVCEHADRLRLLGRRRVLEVEFRLGFAGFETEVDKPGFLPRFREKGQFRMLEARGSGPVG